MQMHWRGSVVVLLLVASAACQRTTTVVKTIEGYKPRTWIGSRLSEVEAVWGPAKGGESDGLGGRIITYKGEQRDVPLSAVAAKGSPSGADGDSPGLPDRDLLADAMGPAPVGVADEDAKFWIDSSGKVYRYWFSELVWRKDADKTTPPAPPR